MGVDEGNLQVIDVEILMENFPIHTYITMYTSSLRLSRECIICV